MFLDVVSFQEEVNSKNINRIDSFHHSVIVHIIFYECTYINVVMDSGVQTIASIGFWPCF